MQVLGVGIEAFLALAAGPEDLQVAEHVDDDEAHQGQARDGDDPLAPDGAFREGDEGFHAAV